MRFIDYSDFYQQDSLKNQSKCGKNQKEQKFEKGKKILQYFAKQRSKKSTEIKKKNMNKKQILLGQPGALLLLS